MTEGDDQIIARIHSGETRAYALLVDRYKDRAFSLALRLVGRREEAEELVQDAFVNAYRSLGSFRGDARFATWLHRIVYNLCMTKISRRRPRMNSIDEYYSDGTEFDVKSNDRDPQAGVEQREMVRLIEEEISQLSEKLKTPILLFYLEEMKYEEIAELMGIPIGTVKTYLFRGRAILRERLKEKLRDEVLLS